MTSFSLTEKSKDDNDWIKKKPLKCRSGQTEADRGKINESENASCVLDLALRLHYTCLVWDEAAHAGDWLFIELANFKIGTPFYNNKVNLTWSRDLAEKQHLVSLQLQKNTWPRMQLLLVILKLNHEGANQTRELSSSQFLWYTAI